MEQTVGVPVSEMYEESAPPPAVPAQQEQYGGEKGALSPYGA